jgi:hypothetical protein
MAGLVAGPAIRAFACAGPCAVPALQGVTELSGETVVVTNFGLLTRRDGGWLLTCEERIGGLILTVEGDSQGGFVSTSNGLFETGGDICSYTRAATSDRSEWLLDYAVARDVSARTVGHFALTLDSTRASITVERAEGEAFEVLQEFPLESGFDEIAVGGSPPRVYVAGYPNDTREWRLTYGGDDGEEWVELRPTVDNAYTTMTLLGVDPNDAEVLFVHAQTVVGQGHELWRFDARSQAIEQVLILESSEVMGGFAFDDGAVWVAGRRRDGGSLYRADRETLAFERVVDDGPPFECLAALSGELHACVNDFTYASNFLLGTSRDGGETWTPALTLDDLGGVDSCGEDCASTTDQLHADYGVAPEPEPSPNDSDASLPVPSANPDPSAKRGGCALGTPSDARWGLALCVSVLAASLRRARAASRRRRAALLWGLW